MSVITQKPNVRNVWASQGNTAPATIDKILEGWVAEIPENEVANWVEYRQDNAIKYLFQEGFAEWDGLFEYRQNSLVKYNGIVYAATGYSLDKQPDLFPDLWSVAFDQYGASKAVQDIVDKILNDEAFLSLYVSKSNPVMSGKAKAPSYQSDVGTPSTVKGNTNVGYSFDGDDNTGMFKSTSVGGKLGLYVDGVLGVTIPKGEQPITSNDETIVTTSYLKRYIDARLQSSLVQVGMSIITNDARDPATYLLYGTWELDCQGRSVVGLSKSVSNTIPEWVKTVNNLFGEYTTNVTIPNNDWGLMSDHISNTIAGKLVIGSGRGEVNETLESLTQAVSPQTVTTSIVQPSQVKYIYTRVG